MIIEITTEYGFAHNWTLIAYGRSFYLGQDVKFCHRVLGMGPRYVVQQIGDNDLRKDSTRKKLAKFICSELGLNRTNVKQLNSWELSAQ